MATRKKSETFQIVIAWTCVEHVHDGKPYARDLGARPGMRQIRVGKACMWVNRGTVADLEKARAYAAGENAKNTDTDRTPIVVFRYPSSESVDLVLTPRLAGRIYRFRRRHDTMTTATATVLAQILPHVDAPYAAARALRYQEEREAAFAAIVPEVGMGATWHGYSDAHACTIVAVSKSGREITVREDRAKLLNGFNSGEADALEFTPGGFCGHTSGRQRYAYTANPEGKLLRFSRRTRTTRDGRVIVKWVEVGSPAKNGRRVTLGHRDHFYDFNF